MNKKLVITGIPSKSVPGDFHTVSFSAGKISCDCIHGKYNEMKSADKKITFCEHIKDDSVNFVMLFLEEVIKLKNND